MIEIKNLLFQPLTFHLSGGGRGLHLNPRESRTLEEDDISPEIDVAAKRGFVSLTPVTPIAPEPEPPRDEPVEIGVDIGGENAGKRRKRR
ncbi:MAG: hypothetical protein AAC993_06450 [Dehalococcoides mccartyi]|uniref:hypothetical protein n=1 Tax=Dehalococcoides mccartyi TaxID=61435 RepID=UPI0030FA11D9